MAPQLAFIGLGLMGQAMTQNLVEKGGLEHPIVLYNRTSARAEEHSAHIGHSVVALSIEEAITKADIIWSCVQNQDAVAEIFDKATNLDIRGKLFVECSTILPDVTTKISEKVLAAGGEFIAMPVFGEPSLARVRKLVCVAAGAATSVEKIKPYVTGVIGRALIDLSGEEPCKASLFKMIGNVFIMTTMETVAELNVFSEKSGLGIQYMRNFIEMLLPDSLHLIYWDKMASGEYYQKEPMVEVHKARELTSQVLDVGKTHGVSLKSYEVVINHLADAESHAGPAIDITGIYGAVRLESGLPFENKD